MLLQRWHFHNPTRGWDWTVPINPNEMTSPHGPRGTIGYAASPIDSQVRAHRPHLLPHEWTFSGVIRTQDHLDTMRNWCASAELIEVTDHLDRTFRVRLFAFEPVERKPTPFVTWRFRYTVRAYMYGRIS